MNSIFLRNRLLYINKNMIIGVISFMRISKWNRTYALLLINESTLKSFLSIYIPVIAANILST